MSNYTRVGLTLIGDGANVALPANTTLQTISNGDLFVVDEGNNILATATASAAISRNSGVRIIQGTGCQCSRGREDFARQSETNAHVCD